MWSIYNNQVQTSQCFEQVQIWYFLIVTKNQFCQWWEHHCNYQHTISTYYYSQSACTTYLRVCVYNSLHVSHNSITYIANPGSETKNVLWRNRVEWTLMEQVDSHTKGIVNALHAYFVSQHTQSAFHVSAFHVSVLHEVHCVWYYDSHARSALRVSHTTPKSRL